MFIYGIILNSLSVQSVQRLKTDATSMTIMSTLCASQVLQRKRQDILEMIPLQDKLKNKPQKKCTYVSLVIIKAEYHKITTVLSQHS